MAVRKGQIFILTALIFASLFVLVGFSYQSAVQPSDESDFNEYFDRSKDVHVKSFNHGLNEDYSSGSVKRQLYVSNRFVDRRTDVKAIDYGSAQVFVLPEKGELTLINYRDSQLDYNVTVNGDSNTGDLDSLQSEEISFSSGSSEIKLLLEQPSVRESFTAHSPKLFNYIKMERSDELWRSTSVH